tara:strand:- start:166 stop:969 length:804 start_codon:yes stop_codon:yes gene_type:complete
MKKILIIGKRGFIGNNLNKYLKKNYPVKHINFRSINKYKKKINNFNYVINTSINNDYIKKRYNEKLDNDLKISNLIKSNKISYIFLSTRKVYKSQANINEKSKLNPKTNYSKNKLITEKKLISKFKKKLIVLRISNIIGDRRSNKKLHNTFIDVLFKQINRGFILDNHREYKDFISIDKFCEIIKEIIRKNLTGIFNVSIGEKIFLNEMIQWLNKYNPKKVLIKNKLSKNFSNFYLNNKKLMSKIKIKNSKNDLKRYCFRLSKKKFS